MLKEQDSTGYTSTPSRVKFLLHSNCQLAENRHVMCVVEKAGFEPRSVLPTALANGSQTSEVLKTAIAKIRARPADLLINKTV